MMLTDVSHPSACCLTHPLLPLPLCLATILPSAFRIVTMVLVPPLQGSERRHSQNLG